MSEDWQGAIDTGMSAASLGHTLGASWLGPVGLVAGFALGHRAKKKRKEKERLERKQKADTMLSQAYERGRLTRKKAETDRSKFAGGGLSTSSGSAASGERGTVREGIYQQAALLAGLPKGHKARNPAMFGMA